MERFRASERIGPAQSSPKESKAVRNKQRNERKERPDLDTRIDLAAVKHQ
jgi:hypothetical protein